MPPEAPATDDEIDRKSLRALRERFLGLNRERLEALRARLAEEPRTLVDALPLLLHSNHAGLPGFVDFEMPCGIDRYTPDRRSINAVRKIALSFVLERFVERRTQIQALYVTTLPGEVLELSVCCAFAAHAALNEKLARLVRYAAGRGVALQTLLLDPAEEQARRSRLHTPHLARDAFYRSAILLAGRYPVWWLVPPQLDHAHDAYCARLKAQRFIGRDEAFDLGRAEAIPPGECIIAGIDLLEAALTAPYAHIPSLMLLESYANGSGVEPLAHGYKERIWRGDPDADSSTLLDDAIAAYLTGRGEMERLGLARDCRRALSQEPTITELQRENARINAELQRAHLHLTRLASEPTSRSADALTRLAPIGDRIAQLIERRDGTIPRINPALWPRRVAGMVRLEAHDRGWRLLDGNTRLFTASRLAAVISWAHMNRLGTHNLRITDAFRPACNRMLELLAQNAGGKSLAPSTLLIINAEESPQPDSRAHGDAIVSDWDDSLDFSGFHTSLVAGIDVLDVRADGIAPRGHKGDDGLIAVLIELLTAPPASLHVRCVGGERERAIEERVATLAARLKEAFLHDERGGRFAFALADGAVIVERSGEHFSAHRCTNEAQLFETLATPGRGRNLRIDPRSIRLDALRKLCDIARPDRETVLIHERRGTVSILLAMRDGSMHRFDPPQRSAHDIADDLTEFLAQQRSTDSRTPEIYFSGAADVPHRVVASDRGPKHGSGKSAAVVGSRRSLVAMLREKFATETELARRPTVA